VIWIVCSRAQVDGHDLIRAVIDEQWHCDNNDV
jgi:hypothetical protein